MTTDAYCEYPMSRTTADPFRPDGCLRKGTVAVGVATYCSQHAEKVDPYGRIRRAAADRRGYSPEEEK